MKLGIIGCGNMGEIFLDSLVKGSVSEIKEIVVSEKDNDRGNYIKSEYKVDVLNNVELVEFSDVVILAVKPQELDEVLSEIVSVVDSSKLIISIAAGVRISFIQSFFNEDVKVIRVMPNTACVIKKGISALSKGKFVELEDMKLIKNILSETGEVIEVEEEFMDIITAVSGSGPGYLSYIVKALIDEAVGHGLDKEIATKIVLKTLSGTAELLKSTGMKPSTLIDKVASKGGTTEAALNVFDEAKLSFIIKEAVKKAALRSKELSK